MALAGYHLLVAEVLDGWCVMGSAYKFWAILSVIILVAGCSAKGTDPGTAKLEPQVQGIPQADAMGVMSPVDALTQIPDRETSVLILECTGRSYQNGLAQRVENIGSRAQYLPQWPDNKSGIEGLAYGIYRFNLTGTTGYQTLDLEWGEVPIDWDNVWVGFSHWESNSWKWKPCPIGGLVNLGSSGYAEFSQPGTGNILVAVVLLGTEPARLDMLTIGESAQGDWWMFGRNPDHTGMSQLLGPQTEEVKWEVTVDEEFTTSAAFDAEGTAYVGNRDGKLYAINSNGLVKWTYATAAERMLSNPAVGVDGTIYVGGYDNLLHAINPDGSQKWTFETAGTIQSSPAIAVDGTVYLGGDEEVFFAINPDGSLKWSFSFIPEGASQKIPVNGSPAIGADGTIYLGSYERYLLAINPDGSLKWSYWVGKTGITTPVIASDGTIYVRDNYLELYAFNPDGTLKWEADMDSVYSNKRHLPALGPDGTIYLAFDFTLFSINPADGSVLSSASRKNDYAPVVGSDGLVYAGSESILFSYSPDLTENWYCILGGSRRGGPAIGPNGTLFFGGSMLGSVD